MRTMCASVFDILPNANVVRRVHFCRILKKVLEIANGCRLTKVLWKGVIEVFSGLCQFQITCV